MKKMLATVLFTVLCLCTILPGMPVSAADGVILPPLSDDYYSHGYKTVTVGETVRLASLMTEYDRGLETYPLGTRNWSSKDPEIAAVTGNGVVTAKTPGMTKISVTYDTNRAERITATLYLIVTEGKGKTAPAFSLELDHGKKINLRELMFPGTEDGTFQWEVKDSFLAEVDKNGVLTADVAGSCSVVATHTDDAGNVAVKTLALKVNGEYEREEMQSKVKITLAPGETIDLIRAVFPDRTELAVRSFTCRTDDIAVATVGDDRRVTAKGGGACTVDITDARRGEVEMRQEIQVVVK